MRRRSPIITLCRLLVILLVLAATRSTLDIGFNTSIFGNDYVAQLFSNTWFSDIDMCNSSPCEHNGTCVSLKLALDYECVCTDEFVGLLCETAIDACCSQPCRNHGVCVSIPNPRSYVCNCRDGYSGTNCQAGDNPCAALPCLNGAMCTNHNDSFICRCFDQYSGPTCATEIDIAEKRHTCKLNVGGTALELSENIQFCDIFQHIADNVTKALPDVMKRLFDDVGTLVTNNVLTIGDKSMQVMNIYLHLHGLWLEQLRATMPNFNQLAPCRGRPCSHGARCIPRGAGGYSCECSAGYSGQHCDVQGGRNTADGVALLVASVVLACALSISAFANGVFIWQKIKRTRGRVACEYDRRAKDEEMSKSPPTI